MSEKKSPSCKICCACPQERRARDECTIFKSFEECSVEIDAFYSCLLTEGFSQEEVDKLRRNVRKM
jgi:cytochrome c oxidase assembly protein subunit 17